VSYAICSSTNRQSQIAEKPNALSYLIESVEALQTKVNALQHKQASNSPKWMDMSYAICSSTNRQSQIAEKPTLYLFYVRESVWLIPEEKMAYKVNSLEEMPNALSYLIESVEALQTKVNRC